MNVLLDLVVCGPGARMCGGITNILRSSGGGAATKGNHRHADICIDYPRFWDRLAGINDPPIPEVIDVISGSDDNSEGYDDSVSLLSEIEVVGVNKGSSSNKMKAYQIFSACHRHHQTHEEDEEDEDDEVILVAKQDQVINDLYLHPSQDGGGEAKEDKHEHGDNDNNDDSLAVSSFDSRMGDTRYMVDEEDEYDYKTKRVIMNDVYDDGSSYSSYYFRLRPSCQDSSEHAAMSSGAVTHSRHIDSSWQTTSTRTTENRTNPSRYHRYDY